MKSEREAVWVMERLDGRWIYGSHIRVSWAKSGGRGSFWRRKRVVLAVDSVQSRKGVESLKSDSIASVIRLTQPKFLDLLGRCVIGWCRSPIPTEVLVEEMRATTVNEAHMMRIIGNMVLVIFDSTEAHDCILAYEVLDTWFECVENWKALCGLEHHRVWLSIYSVPIHPCTKETFERIASIWGSVICVEEETLEPISFERGKVLIESSALDRMEYKFDMKCDGSSSEQRGSLVNSEASDSPELGLREGRVQWTGACNSGCDMRDKRGGGGAERLGFGVYFEASASQVNAEVEMVFIMETKLATVNDRLVKQVWRSDSYVFDFIPFVGLSWPWGILVIWDPSKFDATSVTYDLNFLFLRGHWVSDRWESVTVMVAVGALRSLAECQGRFFTCYGLCSKGSQLDQFLVFAEWLDHFDRLEQRNLPHSVSDHDPIRLSYGEISWGLPPFCFLNVWLEYKGNVSLWKPRSVWMNLIIFSIHAYLQGSCGFDSCVGGGLVVCYLLPFVTLWFKASKVISRVKALFVDIIFDKATWWQCPLDCSFPVHGKVCRVGVAWIPPMPGALKFNVDGVARGKLSPAGCGGVLRDSEGRVLACFSEPFGYVGSIIIESNSVTFVSWVLHRELRPWLLGHWFRRIDSACLRLSCVCFNNDFGEANGMDDVLAKVGVSRSDWLCFF
ncbi:hypothetical protein GQ457_10G006570 [Hibiscus cannabinus]